MSLSTNSNFPPSNSAISCIQNPLSQNCTVTTKNEGDETITQVWMATLGTPLYKRITSSLLSPTQQQLLLFPNPVQKLKGLVLDLKTIKPLMTFEEDELFFPHWFANETHFLVKTELDDGEQCSL
jgi:hypothetical protein